MTKKKEKTKHLGRGQGGGRHTSFHDGRFLERAGAAPRVHNVRRHGRREPDRRHLLPPTAFQAGVREIILPIVFRCMYCERVALFRVSRGL